MTPDETKEALNSILSFLKNARSGTNRLFEPQALPFAVHSFGCLVAQKYSCLVYRQVVGTGTRTSLLRLHEEYEWVIEMDQSPLGSGLLYVDTTVSARFSGGLPIYADKKT